MLVPRMNNSTNTFAPIGDRSMVLALGVGGVLGPPPLLNFLRYLPKLISRLTFYFELILKFLKSFQEHNDPKLRRAERKDNCLESIL